MSCFKKAIFYFFGSKLPDQGVSEGQWDNIRALYCWYLFRSLNHIEPENIKFYLRVGQQKCPGDSCYVQWILCFNPPSILLATQLDENFIDMYSKYACQWKIQHKFKPPLYNWVALKKLFSIFWLKTTRPGCKWGQVGQHSGTILLIFV